MIHRLHNDKSIRLCLYSFRADTKNYPVSGWYSMNSNGTELEQVVYTHRTSCWKGRPRGLGEMNPSPHSWIFTSFAVDSSPYSYLCTSATVRIPVHATLKRGTEPQRDLICDAPLSWSARRNFSPKQKSRRNRRSYVRTEALSGMVFGAGARAIRDSMNIALSLTHEKCYHIWNGYLYFLNWFI